MRLLAPALAAMRSTRAPARPWAANSCFASSRMRSRMPSGSRCHFAVFFDLAKIAAHHSTHADVARVTGFENEDALSAVVASEAKQSILLLAKLDCFVATLLAMTGARFDLARPRRPLQQQRVDAAGAVSHAHHPRARLAA